MDLIQVTKRNTNAKAKQLRRAGIVPCCVYGGALPDALSIQMEQKSADQLQRTLREGSKVRLALDGQTLTVQIKEMKTDILSNQVEHIQFQALSANQKVNSVAHILLKNAELVPGVLEQLLFEVPFASLPRDMIDTVTVDLENRPVGTVITLADSPEFTSDAVELQVAPDSVVLRIADKQAAPAEEPADGASL